MKLLFIHQNFPGQFKHLAPALAAAGHDVHALHHTGKGIDGVTAYRYKIPKGTTPSIHPWAAEFETKVIRGEACAKGMLELRAKGFVPDVVVAHPGWGEALFVKDVWPRARLLAYLEFFYAMQGADVGFDAEFERDDFAERARLRIKNANNLLNLPIMDRGICPTRWQWQTFPAHDRDKIEVIFDGIDIQESGTRGNRGTRSLILAN